MGLGLPEMLLILAVVVVLFGAGKLPSVMGDLAKGVGNFKAGLKDDPEVPPTTPVMPRIAPPLPPAADGDAPLR
jgi:sec-independent protein translocase protein TatA